MTHKTTLDIAHRKLKLGADSIFDRDQPGENAGAPLHARSHADDPVRRRPDSVRDRTAIPPLAAPSVEGVDNEGAD